ncbi:MAG: succinoglycan biosynthesis transport protein ExoP [Halioglobus sp.]|jgi:capsular exopolysaccharide synthesis family protein
MSRIRDIPPQLSANQVSEDDFIDLSRLLRAILLYKWGILGLGFIVALLAGLLVFSMEPVYRATASIALESQEANVVSVEEVYSLGAGNYQYTQTQFEILKSRNLAERVVRRLELHKHPTFLPDEEQAEPWFDFDFKSLLPAREKEPPIQLTQDELDEQAIQWITGDISGNLSVSPVEFSFIVYISYESINRELAAQIVNAVAEEFISGNLETRLLGTLQATDWLGERLADLKLNLRASEHALQDFRDQEGLVDVEGVTGLGGAELRSLSNRLEEVNKARIEAENIKEEVQGMRNASTEQLMTIPAVLRHQLIRELKSEHVRSQRKVDELGKRYGLLHPKMIAAQSDLTAATKELSREVRKVVSGISREYEVALKNEQQLRETWESRKSEMQDFNRIEFQLEELQRDVDTNRQLYDIFFTRIKSVSETGGFEKPHARVLDRALAPNYPVKPNKKLTVILAFILGLMLGCGVSILLDILDNTISSPDDVQEKLGVPLLGVIPKAKRDKSGEFERFWENTQSHYAEAIRTVRTGIVLSGLDSPAKIILVTSTVQGEGKSTTALNLGAALGQMEKTLIIGGDLRRPSLARECSLAPNHQGLSHFVSGAAKLEECIEYLSDMNVHVMPAGVIPPNPLEMISSKKFVASLQYLKERYQRIIIDSAPVQAVSDALILASYADSIIYVVNADSTSATLAQKGIASMRAANGNVTGVVLNLVDAKKAGKYYQFEDYYQSDVPA